MTLNLPQLLFSAYKSSAADSLLAERGRIDSSHQMTDDILQYVYFWHHNWQLIHVADVLPIIDKHMKLAPSFRDSERR